MLDTEPQEFFYADVIALRSKIDRLNKENSVLRSQVSELTKAIQGLNRSIPEEEQAKVQGCHI